MIYLDYQATTPLAPEVRTAMAPWLENFANPHSPNREGRKAAAAIEVAREQVRAGIGLPGNIAFTGSATEALNWALKGVLAATAQDRCRIVTIATEHAAVLDTCDWLEGRDVEVMRLPVSEEGLIDLAQLDAALDERVAIVSAMLVNNEIGVLQPVAAIAAAAHGVGAVMLCDAVQGFGRVPIPEGPDMIAISAHKAHGPKGVGALWVGDGVDPPPPLLHGGGQERGLRSGTLSPMLCAGFGAASQLASASRVQDAAHIERLWSVALNALGSEWEINGSVEHRYRGSLNIRCDGFDAMRLLAGLRDIAFSLGSACASGSGRPSHVLRALGLTPRQTRGSIRLGFGRYTSADELGDACTRIAAAARAQQDFAK